MLCNKTRTHTRLHAASMITGCTYMTAHNGNPITTAHACPGNQAFLLDNLGSNVANSPSLVLIIIACPFVKRAGPCKDAISQFCKDTGAGEGRLAQCLTKRIVEQSKGNVAGRKVGDKCKENLLQFKIDRSANINKDLPLGASRLASTGCMVAVMKVRLHTLCPAMLD